MAKLQFPTGQSMSTRNPAKWPIALVSLVLSMVVLAFAWAFGRPIGTSLANRARDSTGLDDSMAESPDTLDGVV